ncbi:hypothetical protein ASD45_00455 [Pseudolabrys sp. Root1462]|jgi:hypothetical protein|uniref:hypothetical protein n=1 Tax=Pseudolabrys sp. Root1462 TaxID=1736466 RepID=UPI000702A322|nr:hypothetical protein [Pseudolabrys sp. Root1462]KQY99441.1 hypothetical protein ASD45_00455 [Pseudolabrys sp. Root1462]HTJ02411.1 hypothetical protein [Methylovirgula sp.]
MTKITIALVSLLAVSFATSALASDGSMLTKERDAYWQTQNASPATEAYAFAAAPINASGITATELREFNRVPVAEVSSH